LNLPGGRTARLVGASYEGAFAVTNDDTIYAWGRNPGGSLALTTGNDTTTHRIPTEVSPGLKAYASRITFIAGGYRHGHAILNNGEVIGWGTKNRLGGAVTGSTNVTLTPVTIIGIPGGGGGAVTLQPGETVVELHSRFIGSIARTSHNRVFTWGSGAFDIYGSSVTLRSPPTGRTIVEIGGGKEHVYYRTDDGRAWGVGYGAAQKLSLSSSVNQKWPGVIVGIPNN
jgi:alpha-tubulin suppressor-like RCC1 family protein